jgi:hypothetical protein
MKHALGAYYSGRGMGVLSRVTCKCGWSSTCATKQSGMQKLAQHKIEAKA